MKKPHFYYADLRNYNEEMLINIILWQKQEIERLKEIEYRMKELEK
jgi:hypothetical protein